MGLWFTIMTFLSGRLDGIRWVVDAPVTIMEENKDLQFNAYGEDYCKKRASGQGHTWRVRNQVSYKAREMLSRNPQSPAKSVNEISGAEQRAKIKTKAYSLKVCLYILKIKEHGPVCMQTQNCLLLVISHCYVKMQHSRTMVNNWEVSLQSISFMTRTKVSWLGSVHGECDWVKKKLIISLVMIRCESAAYVPVHICSQTVSYLAIYSAINTGIHKYLDIVTIPGLVHTLYGHLYLYVCWHFFFFVCSLTIHFPKSLLARHRM